jgi:acetyl-CoA carboxylase biotin carboxylase subunit
MVAKLVAWGQDRREAIERLRRALSEFVVKGIKTSIPFHRRLLRHPVFREGRYDTGFIEEHMAGGKGGPENANELAEARRVAFMLAAIAAYRRDKERATRTVAHAAGARGGDPWKEFGRRGQMRGGLR